MLYYVRELLNNVYQQVRQGAWMIYYGFVFYPFEQLYLRGYLRGEAREDMCARVTGQPSVFWLQHSDACTEIVARYVDSFVVIVVCTIYFMACFYAAAGCARVLCAYLKTTKKTKK